MINGGQPNNDGEKEKQPNYDFKKLTECHFEIAMNGYGLAIWQYL